MAERPDACPSCCGSVLIKSCHAYGRQRWQCQGCGRQFTHTTPGGKPMAMKREAVSLCCMGLSLNTIRAAGAGRPPASRRGAVAGVRGNAERAAYFPLTR